MLDRISRVSIRLLAFAACLAFTPSLHADGLSIGYHDTYAQATRPLDGTTQIDFTIQLLKSPDFVFGGITVSDLYNANGDKINLVVPNWSASDFPKFIGTQNFFWALIDKDTPAGLYDSSSSTSYQPGSAFFTAFAFDPLTLDGTTVSINFSLEIHANPLAVPEPSSALLACLGALAPLGRLAVRRRAGRRS